MPVTTRRLNAGLQIRQTAARRQQLLRETGVLGLIRAASVLRQRCDSTLRLLLQRDPLTVRSWPEEVLRFIEQFLQQPDGVEPLLLLHGELGLIEFLFQRGGRGGVSIHVVLTGKGRFRCRVSLGGLPLGRIPAFRRIRTPAKHLLDEVRQRIGRGGVTSGFVLLGCVRRGVLFLFFGCGRFLFLLRSSVRSLGLLLGLGFFLGFSGASVPVAHLCLAHRGNHEAQKCSAEPADEALPGVVAVLSVGRSCHPSAVECLSTVAVC